MTDERLGRPRTFVAAFPDDATIDALSQLARPEVAGVRWTPPEQWHVTLRFAGALDLEEIEDLIAAIETVADDHGPLTATYGPATETLGRAVLMVPVGGLDELAVAITSETKRIGKRPEDRPFLGHMTLARRRRGRAQLSELAGIEIGGEFGVGELAILDSQLGPDGPIYTPVATIALGGS